MIRLFLANLSHPHFMYTSSIHAFSKVICSLLSLASVKPLLAQISMHCSELLDNF